MKFFKYIVPIITLCTIDTIHTKGLKQTGTMAPNQVMPQPTQPNRTNKPARQPQPLPQSQQKEYNNILDQLRKMQPTANDFSILRDIQEEANRQMVQTESSNPTYSEYLTELFQKYPINLTKTKEQCEIAAKNDADVFTEAEQLKIVRALNDIVKDFITQFPETTPDKIYDGIFHLHLGFAQLQGKLSRDQKIEIMDFIKSIITFEYKRLKGF